MWISTERRPSFGFEDGISNPLVTGFDTVIPPGPSPVQPGVIVTGKTGDPGLSIRKDWSTEGSFAVFRWLSQDVPGFNNFLIKNPLPEDGNKKPLTPAEGSELLGARMVGRWKSGAPIDISPFQDDPVLAKDPNRFIYSLASTRGNTDKLTCCTGTTASHLRVRSPPRCAVHLLRTSGKPTRETTLKFLPLRSILFRSNPVELWDAGFNLDLSWHQKRLKLERRFMIEDFFSSVIKPVSSMGSSSSNNVRVIFFHFPSLILIRIFFSVGGQ